METRLQPEGWDRGSGTKKVTLNLGKGQSTRNSKYLRGNVSEGQVTLGRGAYLPLRKLCCSEGLVSLLKRTEAHTRQTFLLPDPQLPLPGGGGRSQEDRLRVTTYQASPGLICTRFPSGAKASLTFLPSGSLGQGDAPSCPQAFGSNLPPGTDSSLATLEVVGPLKSHFFSTGCE